MKAARAFYEFWNTGDEALLKQALAETFTVLPPTRPKDCKVRGRRRIGAQLERFSNELSADAHVVHANLAFLVFPSCAYWSWCRAIILRCSRRLGPSEKEINMIPLKRISDKLNTWRRYREAVRELSQFSDRELSDIGIRRCDIEDIVRRPFARKAGG